MEGDAMTALEKLEFIRRVIFESIISTFSSNEKPNATPMGVVSEDMKRVVIRPFTTAQTLQT
jgi:hypothetical protein